MPNKAHHRKYEKAKRREPAMTRCKRPEHQYFPHKYPSPSLQKWRPKSNMKSYRAAGHGFNVLGITFSYEIGFQRSTTRNEAYSEAHTLLQNFSPNGANLGATAPWGRPPPKSGAASRPFYGGFVRRPRGGCM